MNFGDTHDSTAGFGSIFNRIASILIRGTVAGSATAGDHFGVSASGLGSFKSLGFTATLTPGAGDIVELSPITGDATLRES